MTSVKLPHRRHFLHLAVGAAALPAMPRIASALDYPTRPVRIVVGFPAGGSASDIVARLLSQWLTERLGQQFIVENKPGAASNIATESVVKASPDGYSLLLVTPPNTFNATLYDNLSFNFIRDISPIAGTIRVPYVMVVNQSVPAKTVPEFIAHAKANPGKINVASGGIGSTPHVAGELFKMMTGVNLVHVPYPRGSFYPDLLGGEVQVAFSPTIASIEFIRTGKLRALAVTTTMRSETLPDVPTVGESVPGYEASGWLGVGAPRNTSSDIIEKLNKEINAGINDPRLGAKFAEIGGIPFAGSPGDFGKLIVDETEKWAKVIKFANIKPE